MGWLGGVELATVCASMGVQIEAGDRVLLTDWPTAKVESLVFCTKNDGFCTDDDRIGTKSDGFCTQVRDMMVKMGERKAEFRAMVVIAEARGQQGGAGGGAVDP